EAGQRHVAPSWLAGGGSARSGRVRHRGQVCIRRGSGAVATEHDRERRFLRELLKPLIFDELSQIDGDALIVRDFESYSTLAGDRRNNAYLSRKTESEIVAQPSNFADLRTRRRREFVGGDGGTGVNFLNFPCNSVVRQGFLKEFSRR